MKYAVTFTATLDARGVEHARTRAKQLARAVQAAGLPLTLHDVNEKPLNESVDELISRSTPVNASKQHFYGTTAFGWAVATTRQEVLRMLARDAGADTIKRQVKSQGGLYVWTALVDVPKDTHYQIDSYKPQGVPLSDVIEYCLQNAKGVAVVYDGRAEDEK